MAKKLTLGQQEIKALRKQGLNVEQIARKLGITVQAVIARETYVRRGKVGRPRKAVQS